VSTVLIAVFSQYEVAERMRVALVVDGFPTDRVELTASRELGRAELEPADSPHGKCVQYFRTLLGREDEREYPEKLAQRVDNGAAIVTVLPRGAIETARAAEILDQGKPEDVVGHDLTNHGWEHAAAKHGGNYWIQHLWLQHSADSDCLYCRLFPSKAHSH
jgi:hypothetical protein